MTVCDTSSIHNFICKKIISIIYLDGQELGSDSGKIRVYTNGTMIIDPVGSSDTGTYTCTASNRQGQASTQATKLRVIGMLNREATVVTLKDLTYCNARYILVLVYVNVKIC